jgi:hypothetical protein
VAAFEFQRGRTQVRSQVDTPDSTTVAHGYVDFGAETLEVRVVPDAKGVNLKVPVPVVVHGSLARAADGHSDLTPRREGARHRGGPLPHVPRRTSGVATLPRATAGRPGPL